MFWIFFCGVTLWVGTILVLQTNRTLTRKPLVLRVQPYVRGAKQLPQIEESRPVLEQFAIKWNQWLRTSQSLKHKLDIIDSDETVRDIRSQQLLIGVLSFSLSTTVVAAISLPLFIAILAISATTSLSILIIEQRINRQVSHWRWLESRELPVIAEQTAMLLSSGYSVRSAISRLADQSSGAIAHDLIRVNIRIQQGLDEQHALQEWAARIAIPEVDQFVSVLSLNRQSTNLSRLVAEQARGARRHLHRELLTTIEKRAQQVWIPVTVATLVPGSIFLAIPFIAAIRSLTT